MVELDMRCVDAIYCIITKLLFLKEDKKRISSI